MQPVVNQKSNSFDFFVFVFRLMLSVANKKVIHLIALYIQTTLEATDVMT